MLDLIPNPLVIPVGLTVGLLIAAPMGPVNVLCVQRAVERGAFGGLPAGLGAVLADGLIAAGAAFGLSAIADMVAAHRGVIQSVGGIALLVFAIVMLRAPPRLVVNAETTWDSSTLLQVIWDLPKAFFLTLTNPAAVLGLIAIFGGISAFVEVRGKIDALTLVIAIMAGSLAWWVFLSTLVARVRHNLDPRWLKRINFGAGVLLIAFAAVLIGEVVYRQIWL